MADSPRTGGRPTAPLAVNVEGYLQSSTGQGEAARLYARALEAAGAEVATTTIEIQSVDTGPEAERLPAGSFSLPAASPEREPAVNLLCVNGIELAAFVRQRGEEYFRRPTVGVWAWETDLVPERMAGPSHLLEEIWVYSSYVQRNLAPAVEVPVKVVPLPVLPPSAAPGSPPEAMTGAFTFLYSFSFLSTVERKNPLGLIEAFRRAFAPGEGPQLLLKSVNGSRLPAELERVRGAMGRPDIRLVDGIVGEAEHAALFEHCGCYVSLHRSEGFGLTIAEAMARGKPVIATGFSGNMDFMTEANSRPVGFEIVRIGEGGAVYPGDGRWAEPDLDDAAAAMRWVWERRDEAHEIGERARRDLEQRLSPRTVGEIGKGNLESLLKTSVGGG